MPRSRTYRWVRGFGSFIPTVALESTTNAFVFNTGDHNLINRLIVGWDLRAFVLTNELDVTSVRAILAGVAIVPGAQTQWTNPPGQGNQDQWSAVKFLIPRAVLPPMTINDMNDQGYPVFADTDGGFDLRFSQSLLTNTDYTIIFSMNADLLSGNLSGDIIYNWVVETYFQVLLSEPA